MSREKRQDGGKIDNNFFKLGIEFRIYGINFLNLRCVEGENFQLLLKPEPCCSTCATRSEVIIDRSEGAIPIAAPKADVAWE